MTGDSPSRERILKNAVDINFAYAPTVCYVAGQRPISTLIIPFADRGLLVR